MKKVIKLTESDLLRIVSRVILEQETSQQNKGWLELQKLLPPENFKPYDITQQIVSQGGKVPEKKPTMFWKNATQYLNIELENNLLNIKYSNDNKTNVSNIQKIFDTNKIRNTELEFNGSEIEAGGTTQLGDVQKTAGIINQILQIMGLSHK